MMVSNDDTTRDASHDYSEGSCVGVGGYRQGRSFGSSVGVLGEGNRGMLDFPEPAGQIRTKRNDGDQ